MCGIAGIFDMRGREVDRGCLERMATVMAHRGPDAEGFYLDGPIGLAHRRLAILDLSEAGNQPMQSADGSLTLVYNGEIYNHLELRAELEELGYVFRSRTDTETLLHAWRQWGPECLPRLNGMFAFAVWDSRRHELFLVRDRYGIKPLYYFQADGTLLFASEVKSLLTHPRVSRNVCREALGEYFTFQNVLSDRTMFEGVRLLSPGTWLRAGSHLPAEVVQTSYWDYDFHCDTYPYDENETRERVAELFDQAVTRQLMSDVPVGSYLSGGIDSSSITAVASRNLGRLHTFTAGFDLSSASGMELGFDERRASELMSNLYKTEHYEIVLHAGDMEYVLQDLIWHLEDLRVGQCYPNYYVARLASRFVKVVLSGSGGDELFAGYPWRYYRGLEQGAPGSYLESYYSFWQRLVPDSARDAFFAPSVSRTLHNQSPYEIFRGVFGGRGEAGSSVEELVNASLYFETKTFLHGLFVVEDKLSMAHSLETRVPFLDNDLVDFAMRIPPRMKLRNLLNRVPDTSLSGVRDEPQRKAQNTLQPTADGKTVLRDAMRRFVPDEVAQRVKQGFSAPDASWFRGESIDFVHRVLRCPRASLYEFVQRSYVERILEEHTRGEVNHRLLIWSLLSFETWLKTLIEAPAVEVFSRQPRSSAPPRGRRAA